jgi:hypothetical protein
MPTDRRSRVLDPTTSPVYCHSTPRSESPYRRKCETNSSCRVILYRACYWLGATSVASIQRTLPNHYMELFTLLIWIPFMTLVSCPISLLSAGEVPSTRDTGNTGVCSLHLIQAAVTAYESKSCCFRFCISTPPLWTNRSCPFGVSAHLSPELSGFVVATQHDWGVYPAAGFRWFDVAWKVLVLKGDCLQKLATSPIWTQNSASITLYIHLIGFLRRKDLFKPRIRLYARTPACWMYKRVMPLLARL